MHHLQSQTAVSCRWRQSNTWHAAFLIIPTAHSKHLRKLRTPGTNNVTALAEGDMHTHRHKILYRMCGFSLVASYALHQTWQLWSISLLAVAKHHTVAQGFLDRKWIHLLLPVSLEINNKHSKTFAAPSGSLQEPCFLLQLKGTALLKGLRRKSVKERNSNPGLLNLKLTIIL